MLIDADNVPAKAINVMMAEIANHGKATYKRIYGDFTSNRLNAWKGVLNEHAITPMQQYSYTTGKNATDSALIIDAMDMLQQVFGMGEKKPPSPFIKVCEKLIYLEVLRKPAPKTAPGGKASAPTPAKPISALDARTVRTTVATLEYLGDDTGRVRLGKLGVGILKKSSDLDPATSASRSLRT